MDKIIQNTVELYIQGLITKNELTSIIANEYAKLYTRGQILSILGLD